MIQAFKKNPALYIGLLIPLLMVIVLAGLPLLTSYLVPAPKFNIIYSIRNYQNEGKLTVVNGKLQLEFYNQSNNPVEAPDVYLIDVQSKKITLLNSAFKNKKEHLIPAHEMRTIVFNDLSLKQLDKSKKAPDGYQITTESNDSLFLFSLFFGGNKRDTMSISKSGRIEKFQLPLENYWGARFEGWVIP
jgi:hypothetical protein